MGIFPLRRAPPNYQPILHGNYFGSRTTNVSSIAAALMAIPFEDLKFSRDEDNDVRIEVDISKEALTSAPDYQSLDEQEIVEGANKRPQPDQTRTY
jgi:hypothetical protein